MNVGNISAALAVLRQLSSENGITVDQAGGTIEGWEKKRTTEQMTKDEKREAYLVHAPTVASMFAADPNADLDPAEITQRLGVRNCQGYRSWVRLQLRTLRLAYHANGGDNYHATAGVAADD